MAEYLDKAGLNYVKGIIYDKLDTKANVDGAYELMTVGNAEQLIASTTVEDKSPYLFRTSGGSLDIGDRLNLKSIVGGSVVWNQLVELKEGSGTTPINGIKATKANGIIELSGTSTQSFANIFNNYLAVVGHKYLCMSRVVANPNNITVGIGFLNAQGVRTNVGTDIIGNCTSVSNTNIGILITNGVDGIVCDGYKFYANIVDLTAMFGSTIADYVNTLETATAGSGIAWLKKYGYFTKPYYAYSANTMQSVNVSAHNTVGFNQWDEITELGMIDTTTGQNSDSIVRLRSKNYISILPSTTYYLCIKNFSTGTPLFFYDGNKNYINYANTSPNGTFTTPSNARYLRFFTQTDYGTTYKNDICINFHWDGSRDGEYEPYKKNSYDLSGSHEVTRKMSDKTNLGSFNYGKLSDGFFYINLANATPKGKVHAKAICEGFTNNDVTYTQLNNKEFTTISAGIGSAAYMAFRYDGITTTQDFKTAVNGLYVTYELETPFTETVTNPTLYGIPKLDANNNLYYDGDSFSDFQNLQIVDDFGTEEFVDTRDVPIPVGHLTDYYPDLRAKLEMTPNSPDGNGDYLVRQTNGVNEYVEYVSPIPTPPTTNGTYVLKATVSSGVATLSWVAEE